MASYKVIQDVEAEDKLLGPLTLRQFIYAGVAAIMLYLSYFSATHSASFLLALFLPFAFTCAFFAFPWGRDQPTEVWALAKIRFLLKPRRRIWDQSGAKELVTVTAPKKVQLGYTNGLSETEVRSRLRALADTIDSRGWAIKNANLNTYPSRPGLMIAEPASDRLISPSALPQEVDDLDIRADEDMLDEKNNARAQAVDTMIEASAKAHREQIMENLRENAALRPERATGKGQSGAAATTADAAIQAQEASAGPGGANYRSNDYWFLNQPTRSANIPADMVTFNTQVVTPGMGQDQPQPVASTATPQLAPDDEASLVRALDAKRQTMPTTAYYSHLHTIQPLSQQQTPPQSPPTGNPAAANMPVGAAPVTPAPAGSIAQAVANGMPLTALPPTPAAPPAPPVTPTNQAAILQLANNNDLDVATLAREADRVSPDEVVIKLH